MRQKLREARMAAGLKQREVAEILNITLRYYQKLKLRTKQSSTHQATKRFERRSNINALVSFTHI